MQCFHAVISSCEGFISYNVHSDLWNHEPSLAGAPWFIAAHFLAVCFSFQRPLNVNSIISTGKQWNGWGSPRQPEDKRATREPRWKDAFRSFPFLSFSQAVFCMYFGKVVLVMFTVLCIHSVWGAFSQAGGVVKVHLSVPCVPSS